MHRRGNMWSNRLIQGGGVCKTRSLRSDALFEIALQQLIEQVGYTSFTEAIYDCVFKQSNLMSPQADFTYPTLESIRQQQKDEALSLLNDIQRITKQKIQARTDYIAEQK